MPSKLAEDPRIDPRIKELFAGWEVRASADVASREDLLAAENSDTGKAAAEALRAFLNTCDDETIAPSAGLKIRTESVVSHPDGNKINVQFIRSDSAARVPCVYYIHGGGMYICSRVTRRIIEHGGRLLQQTALPWQWWIFATRFLPLLSPK